MKNWFLRKSKPSWQIYSWNHYCYRNENHYEIVNSFLWKIQLFKEDMVSIPETHKLPRLAEEEQGTRESASSSPGSTGSTGECHRTFKE